MNNRILVTGGCGFIGANLVPMLCAEGWTVLVMDNLSSGSRDYLDGLDVEIVEADIRDEHAAVALARRAKVVVHLAAFGSVVDSVQNPRDNFEVNARGTLTMLNACRAGAVEKFIFASTGGALIGDARPPVDESSVPRPISPYGASKLCGEAYCSAFGGSYGLATVALRFANIYGPYSGHKKGVVTAFIKKLHRKEPLSIYGDGSSSRDYLHVDDLCRGIIASVRTSLPPATVMHLASGVETSVQRLAELLIEISGCGDVRIDYQPRRAGEVEHNFANFDKATELINFSPSVDLEEGLRETYRWYQQHVL